jgi:hypothetical protein
MIDEVEMRRDLARAAQALDDAVAFLTRYDEAQVALHGMRPGWESPLTRTVRDGRLAVDRLAGYVRALTGESLNGYAVHPLILTSHGDPGE